MQEHWSQGLCWISDTLWYVLQNALSYYDEAIRIQIWIPTLLLFAAFFPLLWYARGRFRSMYTLYAFAYLVLNYSPVSYTHLSGWAPPPGIWAAGTSGR